MQVMLRAFATSYGTGPFHPAIKQSPFVIHYWPNITYPNEDDAHARALEILADVQAAANAVSANWNVVEVGA